MLSDFIKRLEVSNYGCLRDVKVDLTRLHAFIGPNDSGKSTILRAVRSLSRIMSVAAKDSPPDELEFDMGLELERSPRLVVDYGNERFEVRIDNRAFRIALLKDGSEIAAQGTATLPKRGLFSGGGSGSQQFHSDPTLVRVLRADARMVRFDPDALREPSTLIPESDRLRLRDERGRGLPGVYDAILNRGDDAFQTIVENVRQRFPTIKNLRLKVVSSSEKVLEVELTTGQRVPAPFMSEGLLYYLAFAAIRYLEPTSVLLVEEPENGLHPVRVQEVMSILREISEHSQVLIATHSPLVVNELQPEEVSVVVREESAGTQVRRIFDTPNFVERTKIYSLGELWLSYANGTNEEPLFRPASGGQ